jgi:hypothetical protein
VLLIVLPLVLGHEAGWPAWCFGCLAAGVALAVVFVRLERRVASAWWSRSAWPSPRPLTWS